MEPAHPELKQHVTDELAGIMHSKASIQGTGTGDMHPPNGHDELPPQQTSSSAEQDQDESHAAAGSLLQTKDEGTQVSTSTLEPVNMSDVAGVPGFFDHVPGSWMHQFIMDLPPDTLLALFRCSRWLAACVVQARTRLTLHLVSEQELTAQQTQARRSTISRLLSMRRFTIGLHVWPAAWQPFPPDLTDLVGDLHIQDGGSSITTCCQWAKLSSLYHLRANILTLTEEDVAALCEAVQRGRLRRLRFLVFQTIPNVSSVNRLVSALGFQLEGLYTSCVAMIKQVSQLTALQRLDVINFIVTEDMMQQLCEHPTIQEVTLTDCEVRGNPSQRSCQWICVRLFRMQVQDLLRMPQGPQIILRGSIECLDHSNHQGMGSALEQCLQRVVCRPRYKQNTFELLRPCEAMAPLLKCMQGVEKLKISSAPEHNLGLAVFWRALPASVRVLALHGLGASSVVQLWSSLPQHVQVIEMGSHVVPAAVLCDCVRSTPAHICEMALALQDAIEYTAEVVASLYSAAPKHLKLEVNMVE